MSKNLYFFVIIERLLLRFIFIELRLLTKLDAQQNKVLDVAMDELKMTGFMDTKEDGVSLVLAQVGLILFKSSPISLKK